MPTSFGFYKIIKERLEQMGYQIIDVSFQDHDFKYKSWVDRVYNLFRKVFLGDRSYKGKLKFLSTGQGIVTLLKNLKGKVDQALIIRSDIYPKFVMDLIRQKSDELIGYQWDGLNRYPEIKSRLKYFDKFYYFDKCDVIDNSGYDKLVPITNFFFSHLRSLETGIEKNTFLFLGSYITSRMKNIVNAERLIRDVGGVTNFIVYANSDMMINNGEFANINFIHQQIQYIDYIKLVLKSEYIVDILVDVHEGLSFRVFEAVGYKKKLITNNKTIRNYDFYHPNNIFILGDEDREFAEFLNLPYVEINENIIEKYDFDNWILRIFT
ncbi:MAG TPA: hypothetical protein DDY75_18985 [Sphingobacterium sp.]|nr:hypothetical protein [Sphingobacterium sp.]